MIEARVPLMLNDLDTIHWESLTSAKGSASDVPGLIRGLCSHDPEQHTAAYVNLVDELWHQGNIYEASMYAIPFLVELLGAPAVPEKARIAVLIGEIATGTPPMHAVKDEGVDWSSLLAKRGRSLENELAEERVYAEAIREEVRKALPILVPYLAAPDSTVRRIVADVISRYPERREEHLRLLRNALVTEAAPSVKTEIQRAIDRLRSNNSDETSRP